MTESPQQSADVFDLDALEREGGAKPSFAFGIEGNRYTMIDPGDMDYRDVMIAFRAANANDFETALGTLLPADEREGFFNHEIPSWKLEKLFDAYAKHYGLGAPGKSRSSRRS